MLSLVRLRQQPHQPLLSERETLQAPSNNVTTCHRLEEEVVAGHGAHLRLSPGRRSPPEERLPAVRCGRVDEVRREQQVGQVRLGLLKDEEVAFIGKCQRTIKGGVESGQRAEEVRRMLKNVPVGVCHKH